MPIAPTEEMLERAREALPELPAARAERLERELGLPAETARLLAFRSELGDFFEQALAAGGRRRAHARQLGHERARGADRRRATRPARELEPAAFAEPGGDGRARSRCRRAPAKRCSTCWWPRAATPRRSWRPRGSAAPRAASSTAIVERAIADNPDAVEKIRAGKGKAIGAIVGAVMRETKGRADGGEVQRLIRESIGAVELA